MNYTTEAYSTVHIALSFQQYLNLTLNRVGLHKTIRQYIICNKDIKQTAGCFGAIYYHYYTASNVPHDNHK